MGLTREEMMRSAWRHATKGLVKVYIDHPEIAEEERCLLAVDRARVEHPVDTPIVGNALGRFDRLMTRRKRESDRIEDDN